MKKIIPVVMVLLLLGQVQAQPVKPKVKNWHYLDYKKDGYLGISLDEAYALLKGRKGKPVIVAVIDSGIDTLQPDLEPVLWKNPGEIPNNNRDDDGNGLVDDYYGWNYLGAPDGENLSVSISDDWRTYHRFKTAFEGMDSAQVPVAQQWQYREWKRARQKLVSSRDNALKVIDNLRTNWDIASRTNELLKKMLGKEVFTSRDLDSITVTNENRDLIGIWKRILDGGETSNTGFLKGFGDYKKEEEDNLIKLTTPPEDYRGKLLGDDDYDISKTRYGNHNLTGFSGYHGTGVSSVIGAVRNNGTGIDGIADNVRIMMIRGILGKDEFDKDVALSIRYAVDHGAKVINMSFGKYISPDKRWVDEAIAYALSKDVVLVHGAGNDATNVDLNDHYPSSYTIDNRLLPNMLQVGASGDASLGTLVASFSNYGKKRVDLFAPGLEINSAIAGNGTQLSSGTSLSSPVVAGIAALLRSYFPKLKAAEVVDIIKRSGATVPEPVTKPGTNEKVALSELCNSGRIANAAGAVKMALKMTGN
ncbi:S8 family serine peptidase [Niabella drilacis]|uniref:Subtilase family protein n=1 Tax=Niabella drilacis (strain DSM 25811 / CCM 8410 / CCUG 62505 / LMG 26954 / E90) TaxID=1285928 RepID=A0A1G6PTS2_NIADE|nr:S8 family serine peptidase [Niabella drilacis]SDC82777.1 Subtilase family protein [Niabella drilacis]